MPTSRRCRLPSELLVSRAGGRTCAALREGGVTVELRVEDERAALAVGHIVKARVSKILPGIQSAFLDVGQERDAFLHVNDLLLPGEDPPPRLLALAETAAIESEVTGEGDAESPAMRRSQRAPAGPPIQDRLKEGRELVVQVVREAFGGKGPRVTCFIALPGRYLVHSPQSSFRGISRRIQDPEERQRLREILLGLSGSSGGFIVRTAGEGADASAFEADARFLVDSWTAISTKLGNSPAPSILHADLDLFLRSLRDAPTGSLSRIVVDDERMHLAGRDYLRELDPQLASRLHRHTGPDSLFDATGVSQDIERALRPRVWLNSGGTIVIEQTEALVSIDVNTGKFVGARRPEETVLKTNLEAAAEIAHQLRLRDLGGIIVVDFIDMDRAEHKHLVIEALEKALQRDRSRTKVVGLSELGLLQLTRKRTRLGIGAALTRECGSCSGTGRMKTFETVAYDALSEVRRVAASFPSGEVTVRTHPDVARALRLALQTAAPILDAALVSRLRVLDDPEARLDQFDVRAL
jgi:ribonuclease G